MKEKSENLKNVEKCFEIKPKIGLLGGTFDPIHFGHLNLAIELKERCSLDQIWFIPAAQSPFKKIATPELADHRLRMVELAISEYHGFKVIDYELRNDSPSYTIDTLKYLLKTFPHESFCLLLGDDLVSSFHLWKSASEIINLIPIYVGNRQGLDIKLILEKNPGPQEITNILLKGVVRIPYMQIESNIIRKRIQQKLYCKHLVPAKVLDYIYQNQLYFND